MTREETQTENGLWEKKRTQRGLYNCMFCLERRVCTSVNHHQGASAEQMAEEGIEPVIDFVSAEGRKTETTESKTVLHVGKLLSCAWTASTRRGSLDMEDMRRQDVNQCKGLLFFSSYSYSSRRPLAHAVLQQVTQDSSQAACVVRKTAKNTLHDWRVYTILPVSSSTKCAVK